MRTDPIVIVLFCLILREMYHNLHI